MCGSAPEIPTLIDTCNGWRALSRETGSRPDCGAPPTTWNDISLERQWPMMPARGNDWQHGRDFPQGDSPERTGLWKRATLATGVRVAPKKRAFLARAPACYLCLRRIPRRANLYLWRRSHRRLSGGFLARSGAEVSVVARGPHLEAIRENGLTVESPDMAMTVKVRASADPSELGKQNAVIVTVNAPSLPGIAPTLAPLLAEETPVVFLTNGIAWWYFHGHGSELDGHRLTAFDPDDGLWNATGPKRLVGGFRWPASSVPEPGRVRLLAGHSRGTILGPPDGRDMPGINAIADAFRSAGLLVTISDNTAARGFVPRRQSYASGARNSSRKRTGTFWCADRLMRKSERECSSEGIERGHSAAVQQPASGMPRRCSAPWRVYRRRAGRFATSFKAGGKASRRARGHISICRCCAPCSDVMRWRHGAPSPKTLWCGAALWGQWTGWSRLAAFL